MARAARGFVATLDADQRAKALIPFTDANRLDWHYVPRARSGLSLKEMAPAQRLLAQALVSSGLSARGSAAIASIMSLEPVLSAQENNPRRRDLDLYYLTIFGLPGTEAPWGWRFEGHHISLNFTFPAPGSRAATPLFLGSNPAEIRSGAREGFRALPDEDDLGRAFVKGLSDAQRSVAIIAARAPNEIVNSPGRKDSKPEGIPWAQLDDAQRQHLLELVRTFLDRSRTEVAVDELARIEAAGFGNLHFAWAGGLEPGEGHYYRIQSGSFVIEFDNVQDGANHIHSVWRDLDRDFGLDLLAEHHRAAHTRSE